MMDLSRLQHAGVDAACGHHDREGFSVTGETCTDDPSVEICHVD